MDSSEINLKEINDGLLSILKCPTCSDYIVPPIVMCSNGHTICKTCSSELSSCSTCKEKFTGRNYAMEELWCCTKSSNQQIIQRSEIKFLRAIKDVYRYVTNDEMHHDLHITPVADVIKEFAVIHERRLHEHVIVQVMKLLDTTQDVRRLKRVAELVMYPCKNASAGCAAKLRLNDKVIHEQDCLLCSFQCFFRDCRLKVSRPDYLQHLNNEHVHRLVVGTDNVMRVLLFGLRRKVVTEWVFSAFDRFFLLTFTNMRTMLEWKVVYEGSMKEASKFYFTFSISDARN